MNSDLDQGALERFLVGLPWREMQEVAAQHCGAESGGAGGFLRSLKEEAKLGLSLVSGSLTSGARVLEVGCGMGLLAGFLRSRGVDIWGLEPGLGGFDISSALSNAISSDPAFAAFPLLRCPAELLNEEKHGRFDLIYSINVLEHIPALEDAIKAMGGVLASDGQMVHACPNYAVPYEPHFGIPLVPFLPRFTEFFRPALRNSELWASLNFVTARRLSAICGRHHLVAKFVRGVMKSSFLRLETDSEFRRRQSNHSITWLLEGLRRTRMLQLLGAVPPSFGTPMVVHISHAHGLARHAGGNASPEFNPSGTRS